MRTLALSDPVNQQKEKQNKTKQGLQAKIMTRRRNVILTGLSTLQIQAAHCTLTKLSTTFNCMKGENPKWIKEKKKTLMI